MMPPGGGEARAEQIELLSTLIHDRVTDPRLGELIDRLLEIADLDPTDAVNLQELRRTTGRERKLPTRFVAERAKVHSLAYREWVVARPKRDFRAVTPLLTRIVELCREEAALVGYEGSSYNALLDQYEPGGRVEEIRPLLIELGDALRDIVPLLVRPAPTTPPVQVSEERQARLFRRVAEDLGYDFTRGRLDKSPHPFMSTVGRGDSRMTTRYFEENPLSGLFSVLHETGHALYDLPRYS
jgi:carboxypeptidase Taq